MDSSPGIPSVTSSYVHGTSSLPLLPLTVGQSLQTAVEKWPDREALVFLKTGIRKTFSQFQEDVSLNFSCLSPEVQQPINTPHILRMRLNDSPLKLDKRAQSDQHASDFAPTDSPLVNYLSEPSFSQEHRWWKGWKKPTESGGHLPRLSSN